MPIPPEDLRTVAEILATGDVAVRGDLMAIYAWQRKTAMAVMSARMSTPGHRKGRSDRNSSDWTFEPD